MSSAHVYEDVRFPFGRYGGALAGVRPDDLAAQVLQALVARVPALDPGQIDEVVYGTANGAGEDNRNVARMGVLLAGWPTHMTGVTVNRLCGASLEAAVQASRAIEVGDATIIVAGGGESMSRSPWVMQKPSRAFPAGNETLHSSALGWRMVNPRMPEHHTISLGESTEKLAATYGIGREEQDAFALRSHALAARAYADGALPEVVPITGVELTRDEGIRPDTSLQKLAKLPAAFGIGPVQAANKVLSRAGLSWDQIDVVELNEAFAGQSLACLQAWPELDPEKVNQRGGAIAIGHPLGASGARILGRLAHELHARGDGYGRAGAALQPARRSRRPAERPRARSAGAPGVPVRGQAKTAEARR